MCPTPQRRFFLHKDFHYCRYRVVLVENVNPMLNSISTNIGDNIGTRQTWEHISAITEDSLVRLSKRNLSIAKEFKLSF